MLEFDKPVIDSQSWLLDVHLFGARTDKEAADLLFAYLATYAHLGEVRYPRVRNFRCIETGLQLSLDSRFEVFARATRNGIPVRFHHPDQLDLFE